jgi:hypothetical protein
MALQTEVKFTMSISALDALRLIVQRDFLHDVEENKRAIAMPQEDPKRMEIMRELFRHEGQRALIERTLGFDGSKNEMGA